MMPNPIITQSEHAVIFPVKLAKCIKHYRNIPIPDTRPAFVNTDDWALIKDETLKNVLRGISFTSGRKYKIENKKSVTITNPK